jgi:adenylate cyclase
VLYFDNTSRDSGDAYLADGLTEEIITRLGQIDRLRVASRFAVRRYRASSADPAVLGRSLGVTHLVSGGIRRVNRRLLVTVELLRATAGLQLWNQQFDRSDSNLLAIEQDIAQAVATGIAGRLLPAERAAVAARPTRNAAAYDHYLRANFLIAQRRQPAAVRALDQYTRATAADPLFTRAWARLALAYLLFPGWDWVHPELPTDSLIARGVTAADRALRLDSLSSDAWVARGMALPLSGYPPAAAVLALQRAVALEPRNAEAWHQLGFALLAAGRSDEAGFAYEHALALEPLRAISLEELSQVRLVQERRDALAADSAAGHDEPLWGLTARAMLAAIDHDTAAALRAVDLLRQDSHGTSLVWAAIPLTLLGARDSALDLLEQARARYPYFWWLLRVMPEFGSLRDHPRFQRLLEESRP